YGLFGLRDVGNVESHDEPVAHFGGHHAFPRVDSIRALSTNAVHTRSIAFCNLSWLKFPSSSKASAPSGTEHCGEITSIWMCARTARKWPMLRIPAKKPSEEEHRAASLPGNGRSGLLPSLRTRLTQSIVFLSSG